MRVTEAERLEREEAIAMGGRVGRAEEEDVAVERVKDMTEFRR